MRAATLKGSIRVEEPYTKRATISKVSGPPGKSGGSSTSRDSFNMLLKYPLLEDKGSCKRAETSKNRCYT